MRVFGHPVHPAVVALPIGLLALMPLWDALSWLAWPGHAALVARFSEVAGLIGGGLAVLSGLFDFVKIQNERVARAAIYHATAAMGSLCLFGTALALRGSAERVSLSVTALDLAGSLVLGVAGWLGGHLVFHHRVAVDD